MTLSRPVLEPSESRSSGFALSRRPVMIATAAFLGLSGLALATVVQDQDRSEVAGEESAEQILVPDREGAAALAKQAPPMVRTIPSGPQPPAPGDQLVVTSNVPQLPGGPGAGPAPGSPSYDPAYAGVGAPPGAFLSQQQMQLEQYALTIQKTQLDLRAQALTAPMRVSAFEHARKGRAQEAADFMKASGADQFAGGVPDFMQAGGSALAAMAAAQGGAGGGAGGYGGPTQGGADPNMSQEKLKFFQSGGQQLEPGRLEYRVQQQRTPYELQMGSIIPGVLITGINSESPGQILGQVSENVYDSATGRHLLIPQGSRTVGTYSALIAQGQCRIQVVWVRLNLPNGASLDLGGMSGADQAGTAGFSDKVNRHFWRRLAGALLSSSFTVAYELTAPRNGNATEGAVHRGVGESIVQLGVDMARQEAALPPTLEIRPGFRFSIMVNKDVTFPSEYRDGIDRRTVRR